MKDAAAATTQAATRNFCVYSAQSINELNDFQARLGRQVDCAVTFNNQASTWSQWSLPWFLLSPNDPNVNWAGWARSAPGRRLILTQAFAPASGMPTNWLQLAAAGAYNSYAVQLASNLVRAGLANSIIRIAPEANLGGYSWSVPDDAQGQLYWRAAWTQMVTAMRSVPGAAFTFDWTVNYQTWARRNISLDSFYPGDAYVDVVGLDAYDENLTQKDSRFQALLTKPGGIQDVYNFAVAHKKPMSMPEWGMLPWGGAMQGGGDDPSYIQGMGQFIANHSIAYSGYWYGHNDTMTLLQNSVAGMANLQQYFGRSGRARVSAGS